MSRINAAKALLKQGKTALFICDVQEKFAKVIFEFDKIVQNSNRLVNLSNSSVLELDACY